MLPIFSKHNSCLSLTRFQFSLVNCKILIQDSRMFQECLTVEICIPDKANCYACTINTKGRANVLQNCNGNSFSCFRDTLFALFAHIIDLTTAAGSALLLVCSPSLNFVVRYDFWFAVNLVLPPCSMWLECAAYGLYVCVTCSCAGSVDYWHHHGLPLELFCIFLGSFVKECLVL